MKRGLVFSIAACVVALAATSRSAVAETTAPISVHRPTIALEVWIVETKGGTQGAPAPELSGPSEEVAARIRKLKAEGQIVAVEHFQLSAVENQKVTLQTGRTVPIPVAQSIRTPAGRSQNSYQQQPVGTLISATARVDERAILVELNVEKSQLERRPGTTGPENEVVPLETANLASQVALQIDSGKTVVAGGLEQSANGESAAQFVLISARLLEPSRAARTPAAADSGSARQIRIFSLEYAAARDAAEIVNAISHDDSRDMKIGVDLRTNSLIVSAAEQDLNVVEALLTRLDEHDTSHQPQAPKAEKKPGTSSAAGKYDKMTKADLQAELKRLQGEVSDAERTAEETQKNAVEAAMAYRKASDDHKGDALLRMIEAEAAGRKPKERFEQLNSTFQAARRAYLQLLLGEQPVTQ